MSVMVYLILVSIAIATVFLAAFIWSVRSGQYEDTSTPAMRILMDDPAARSENGKPLDALERPLGPSISPHEAGAAPKAGEGAVEGFNTRGFVSENPPSSHEHED